MKKIIMGFVFVFLLIIPGFYYFYISEKDSYYNNDNINSDLEIIKKNFTYSEGDNALWVYGNSPKYAEKAVNFIKNYNDETNENGDIDYLFLSSSAIEIRENDKEGYYSTTYLYSSVNLEYFKEQLPDLKLYVMVEADKTTMSLLDKKTAQEIEEITDELLVDLNEKKEIIDGVHFDLEPHSEASKSLIFSFIDKTEYPVSVAFSHYEDDSIIKRSDLPVLMNYAQCSNSFDGFEKAFNRRAEKFFNDCQKYNSSCLHGILITETACEKDSISRYVNISLQNGKKYENISNGYAFFGLNYRTGKVPETETKTILNNFFSER